MASDKWREFLFSYCDIDLERILKAQVADKDKCYPLAIDGSLLLDYNLQLCSRLLAEPNPQLDLLSKAAVLAQRDIKQKLIRSASTPSERQAVAKYYVKLLVQVRLHNLPAIPELVRNKVPGCSEVGKYLLLNGTVIRSGLRKVLQKSQLWKCQTCQGAIKEEGRFELRYRLVPPRRCPHEPCKGYKFQHQPDHVTTCTDYQELKIQEKVERLDMGSLPRSITVILEHDLVDMCKAGDDVTIYGIISQQWSNFANDSRCSLDTVMKANNIEIHNEHNTKLDVTEVTASRHYAYWRDYEDKPVTARNIILASFCPELYQLYVVKLATLLVVLGGNAHVDSRGTKVRGECHLLLVGDPGTGKSQILKYASKLSPRSVITTGIGSTSAGLTVAAVKDSSEWMLEAGAMVLADGGICCIDELSSIKDHDRVAIHEAMEQQSISVAKAGLVCKLNTRTTVLAATNPRGAYDSTQPISVNVPIGTPLLSRFDLILVLVDDHLETWDSLVAGHLLQQCCELEYDVTTNYKLTDLWSFDELRCYIDHVKTLKPRLTAEAKAVLGGYYRLQREALSRSVSRTTIRMLESLIRLSQAHAKLMLREEVILMDAIVTISLVESTLMDSALLGSINILHSVFPKDPELEYEAQKGIILARLGFPADYGTVECTARKASKSPAKTVTALEGPQFNPVQTQKLNEELHKAHTHKSTCRNATNFSLNNKTSISESTFSHSSAQSNSINSTFMRSGNSFTKLIRQYKEQIHNDADLHDNSAASQITDCSSSATDVMEPCSDDLSSTIDTFIKNDVEEEVRKLREGSAHDVSSDTSFNVVSNTPVTRMYEKFNEGALTESKENTSLNYNGCHSPTINTQKHITSSTRIDRSACPLHFGISPIALLDSDVTNNKSVQNLSGDEACKASAQKKLRKFVFKPRKQQ